MVQADFIKAIGAVVPNARIDFRQGAPTHHSIEAWQGMADTIASDCSTAVGHSLCETDVSTAQAPEALEGPAIDGNCLRKAPLVARTPSSGTPEWTPRSNCVDPNCPEWTPECVRNVHKDQASQVLSAPCSLESVTLESHISNHWMRDPLVPDYIPALVEIKTGAGLPSTREGHSNVTIDTYSWYRVAYLGGIELRMQPSYLAARSGTLLPQKEVFAVSAEIVGADGRVYLRLADGRGWAFDDSALLPHDPSVVRGHFALSPGSITASAPPPLHDWSNILQTYPPLETSQLQTPVAYSWDHAANAHSHLPEELPHAWIPFVTSDCPPTWDP